MSDTPTVCCWETEGIGGTQACIRLAEVGHCRHCPVFMDEGRRLFDREIPGEYRASWTARIGEAEPQPVRAAISFVPFRLAGHWLALRSVFCLKVVAGRPVHAVPFRTNAVFMGLANVEGEIVPCASLLAALELAHDPLPATVPASRILVAVRQGARWCFPVDETTGIESCIASGLEPVGGALEGWITLGQRRVGLVNEAHLFPVLEQSLQP